MSCDFAVWYPHRRLSDAAALAIYERLCAGDGEASPAHPAVDAFYAELIERYPEPSELPDDRVDDSPWSCDLDRSPGAVVLASVWSRAEEAERAIHELAKKHGLAVFDPQSGRVHHPDGTSGAGPKPWWKLW